MRNKPLLASAFLVLWAVTAAILAQPGPIPTAEQADVPQPPGVLTLDREARTIDLAAKMVPVEPQWLELIATTPGGKGREHEAIVTVDVKPSELHAALLILGLEPGHPQTHRLEGDVLVSTPPDGPALALSFIFETDGQSHEVPVNEWVLDEKTGKTLPDCQWLFTGSTFRTWQDREYYMADEAGNIVSLVNFGDDLIVRCTDTTKDTDFQQLQIDKERIPPYGSDLILRIRVPKPDPTPDKTPDAAGEPAGAAQNSVQDQPSEAESSDKSAPTEP